MSTLAPPSSTSSPSKSTFGEKGHRNLKPPAPVPASSRPVKQKNQLPLLNLVKVPLRVLSPPKATGMVGSVRSLKATPLNDVRLADVIANKHLSPLSLKDFEVRPFSLLLSLTLDRLLTGVAVRSQGYLVFKEYSAENLYFILWLNEYEKEYKAFLADPALAQKAAAAAAPSSTLEPSTDPLATRTASHLPEYLAESLRRGLDVFFAPDGPLELNLPRATRDKVLVEAGTSGDPRDFAEARDIVEHSLNRSLAQHAKSCVANAGPRRLTFCFCLGLSIFCLGLTPPLVAILCVTPSLSHSLSSLAPASLLRRS